MSKDFRFTQHHNKALSIARGKMLKPSVKQVSITPMRPKRPKYKIVQPSKRVYTSALADVLSGVAIALFMVIIGIILLSNSAIAEAIMLFGIAYCVFFYRLCTAGTRLAPKIKYVSGSAWQAKQSSVHRQAAHLKQRKQNRIRKTFDNSHDSTFTTNSESDLLFSSPDMFSDEHIELLDSHSPYAFTQVNPATGLLMIGGLIDTAGNINGTSSTTDIGLDNDITSMSIDSDYDTYHSFSDDDW